MEKIKKIISVCVRGLIFIFDGLNNKFYTNLYYKFLKRRGVRFLGKPNYISSKAYIDGQGYKKITIGNDVVISREAMLLTHDYSIENVLHYNNKGTPNRTTKIDGEIYIGNNSFIGARVSLLPNTYIGDNCIIGACSTVKGRIPDGSVVIGNPAKIIKKIDDISIEKYLGDLK